jgi:SAM-dependent methyltransferase
MRYGAIPESPLEQRVLDSPASPQPLFDTFLPLVLARAVMAGVRLGLFESLRDGPRTAVELADALQLDAGTLELALRMLACGGYTEREGEGYRLTDLARATLLADSPTRFTAFVGLNAWAWEPLGRLEEVLRSGQGIDMHRHLGDRGDWATYQAAMLENARRLAPRVAPLVPVRPGAEKLLDIAGSHGLFGALICRAHPPMRSEVLDLAEAVESSRGLARGEGIDDLVSHRVGDALVDDLGEGFDVCFLGNILHHFTPEQIRDLLGRIRRALSPGGTVAIWELRLPEPDEPPEIVGDAFALYFRLTSTASCYATSEYTGWLEEAGFADVQLQPTPFAPFQLLATGRAPS